MKNTKIQMWAIELEEFDCEIRYKKGSENQRADFMSRIRNEIHTAAIEECDKISAVMKLRN